MTQHNVWVLGVTLCVVVGVVVSVGPRSPGVIRTATEGSVAKEGRISYAANQEAPDTAVLHELRTITDLILRIQRQDSKVKASSPPPVVQDCSTLHHAGVKGSGVYQVFPFTFQVYCEMETNGGGWTVIQRRQPQDVQQNFARDWADYRQGFGQLDEEMWIGLEALHQLTYSASYELRVDMVDYQLGPKYAHYKVFRVGPESDGYRLLVTNYSGNAGDALSRFHSGRRFSTLDRDQDLARNKSCARDKEGGWWFHACYAAHPNGRHPTTPSRKSNSTEIRWWTNREAVLVLTHIEMKIRRLRPNGTPDEDWAASDDAALGDEDDNYESTLSPEEEGQSEPVDYEAWWKTPWVGTDGGDIPGNDSFWGNEGRSDISPWEVTRRN